MTQQQNLIDVARSYIGIKSNKTIIDTYNTISPLPVGYHISYNDAWCAAFVSACAKQAGLIGIIFPECSCTRMINLYKAKGQWQENESVTPQQGWIIFYDWQDNGIGDNVGISDHVGIVESVLNGKISVIEGNKGGTVGRRVISINEKYLRGYGVPKYTSVATVSNDMCTVSVLRLRKNNRNESVKALQALLIQRGYNCGSSGIDGSFGGNTYNAVVKFQKDNNLDVDGVVGAQTWGALLK